MFMALAVASVLAAGAVVTAGTAHASAATCRSCLRQWYVVGPEVTAHGAGEVERPVLVAGERARTACTKASTGN
ncbi:hypothetical protein ACIPSE_01710 [Streptomyces sp. NPDC090106]|uniref:hypothetical protein n=1 Tax=Streptomyces sp. NPDC090106 TaxID=3365946 RepID=UPI00381EDEC2